MKTHALIGTLAAGFIAFASAPSVQASTYWQDPADGDINNAANWSAGLPSDATGLGAIVGATHLTIDQVFNNGDDNRSQFLIVGTGGLTVATGGGMTYLGDGLFGSTIVTGGGAALITHTGGSLTQDGGGTGFLIGHNAVGTYNISGGNVTVEGAAPALIIDYSTSDGSSLNISGTGQVDVEDGVDLVINSGGTLNVTGGGLLVWHNRTVAETAGFAGTVSATITQVGSDVHFTAVPEPGSLALMGLGGLCVLRRRRA